jgi:hypothetical protein
LPVNQGDRLYLKEEIPKIYLKCIGSFSSQLLTNRRKRKIKPSAQPKLYTKEN